MNSNTPPLVSIVCITYNQASFIRDAIDGFLMQKTKFDFEILIHDDASTDNTADIIREYAAKDNRFITLFQKENKFSKGINPGVKYLIPIARGKYVAVCEGDDYWTDPYKLQKQVDFLEANPDYGLVHTDIIVVDKNNHVIYDKRSSKPSGYVFKDLMENAFIVTCSICARGDLIRSLAERADKENLWYIMDYWLWVHISMVSKIHYIPEVMSAYRSHEGGISKNRDYFFEKRVPLVSLDIINERLRRKEFNGLKLSIILSITYFSALFARHIPFKRKKKFMPLMFMHPWLFYGLFYVIFRKLFRLARSCKGKIY